MTTSTFEFFVFFGTLFGFLAGSAAFVIAYAEYRRRFLEEGSRPLHMAMRTGVVTFLFFLVASILLPWILQSFAFGR
jgi:hypothetical protein